MHTKHEQLVLINVETLASLASCLKKNSSPRCPSKIGANILCWILLGVGKGVKEGT